MINTVIVDAILKDLDELLPDLSLEQRRRLKSRSPAEKRVVKVRVTGVGNPTPDGGDDDGDAA